MAEVVSDADDHPSGTTVDRTAGQARYQSGIAHTLTISGQKFCEGAAADISLAFDPPLTKDADYQVLKVTATQIQLKRLANKKWRQDPGPLLLTKLKCPDGPEIAFGNGQGIAVATILPDPSVDANPTRQIFLTHPKRLTIRGAGFALYADAELSIEPTKRDDCARSASDGPPTFAVARAASPRRRRRAGADRPRAPRRRRRDARPRRHRHERAELGPRHRAEGGQVLGARGVPEGRHPAVHPRHAD